MSEEIDVYQKLADELEMVFGRALTVQEIMALDEIGMPKHKVGDVVYDPAFGISFTVSKIISGKILDNGKTWFYAYEGSTLFTAEDMLIKSGE